MNRPPEPKTPLTLPIPWRRLRYNLSCIGWSQGELARRVRLAEAGQALGITVEAIARGRDGQFVPAGICWVEEDIAELPDGPPLHATEADTPDCHHRPAQRRSGQRRPGAVPRHRPELRQHFVYENVDVGKRIPWARRCLRRTDGSAHRVWARCR
jgi:hypothetical protein